MADHVTERVAIGIDIGGTAIKGGAVTSSGRVLAHLDAPTESGTGLDAVVEQVAAMVTSLVGMASLEPKRVAALGVGVPGLVDYQDGHVIDCANLPGWENKPVAKLLDARTGYSIVMENDANNAALAEARIGAGRGAESMVLITLGTGVGSGIVIDSVLWHGDAGTAGEVGHWIVQPGGRRCSCGQQGCLEVYASATATWRRVVEAVEAGESSALEAHVRSDQPLTSQDVVEAAKGGDAVAKRAWDESCRYLAIASINLQHALNPHCIVFGGGMSAAGDLLLSNVQGQCAEMMSKRLGALPDLRLAELGNDAGFIGAALNALGK